MRAVDGNNNAVSKLQKITVQDTTVPKLTPPTDMIVEAILTEL